MPILIIGYKTGPFALYVLLSLHPLYYNKFIYWGLNI